MPNCLLRIGNDGGRPRGQCNRPDRNGFDSRLICLFIRGEQSAKCAINEMISFSKHFVFVWINYTGALSANGKIPFILHFHPVYCWSQNKSRFPFILWNILITVDWFSLPLLSCCHFCFAVQFRSQFQSICKHQSRQFLICECWCRWMEVEIISLKRQTNKHTMQW